LKNGGFKGNFNDYTDELRAFQHYFMENGPPGPDRRQLMLEFTFSAIDEAALHFVNNIRQDLEVQRSSSEMATRMLEE
jgi:hypothetical protein